MAIPVRVAIVPGNGCTPVQRANWYGWLQKQLHRPPDVEAVLREMPDPYVAREASALAAC
jgi:hypothetical protein